jgi:hypothetical protein
MKPKVLIALLCGHERQGWINPNLLMNVLQAVKDDRFAVEVITVRDCRPWEAARNVTIDAARKLGVDWLISFDNDNFVNRKVLDIIAAATDDQTVIGLRYGVGADTEQYHLFPSRVGTQAGPFREVDCVGGGVMMIRSAVWQKIPRGPWFRWQHDETSELLTPNANSCGEDVYFSKLCRAHGIKLWTHAENLAGHYRTVDLTTMCTVQQQQQRPFTASDLITRGGR